MPHGHWRMHVYTIVMIKNQQQISQCCTVYTDYLAPQKFGTPHMQTSLGNSIPLGIWHPTVLSEKIHKLTVRGRAREEHVSKTSQFK